MLKIYNKNIILASLFLLTFVSFNSYSEQTSNEKNEHKEDYLKRDSFCFNAGKIASKFMEMRQNGNSIIRSLQLANILSNGKEDSYTVFKHFVINAYERPIEKTKIDSDKSVREFSNQIILECIKEVDDAQEVENYKKDDIPEDWLNKDKQLENNNQEE